MKKFLNTIPRWPWLVSALLMFVSSYSKGTGIEWIARPLFLPGLYLALLVFPQGIHSDDRKAYIQLSIILGYIVNSLALMCVEMLFGRFVKRKKEEAWN